MKKITSRFAAGAQAVEKSFVGQMVEHPFTVGAVGGFPTMAASYAMQKIYGKPSEVAHVAATVNVNVQSLESGETIQRVADAVLRALRISERRGKGEAFGGGVR